MSHTPQARTPLTLAQWHANVQRLMHDHGFRFMHARLFALEQAGVIRELCPEPGYWHYEVLRPAELPPIMTRNSPRDGYTYSATYGDRGHIIWR